MILKKDSYIYGETEAIAEKIRGKRNFVQQDTATIALKVVLNEVMDALGKGKSITDLMEDGAKDWRVAVREQIKPLFTASKNFQNTCCVESGLMPKAEGGGSVEEFV